MVVLFVKQYHKLLGKRFVEVPLLSGTRNAARLSVIFNHPRTIDLESITGDFFFNLLLIDMDTALALT